MAKRRERDDWLDRIRAVEREYLVARQAVGEFIAVLDRDPDKLPPNTKVRDANAMRDNLEGTYLVRLYAAFESGLRSYYATLKETTPPAIDLINAIATRRKVPDDVRDEVHEVRKYRNSLVHEGEESIEAVGIGAARGRLCTFFARLPDNWS